jgi:metal-responsive CopG/Arc/MetJ family transcriptional regulator
MRRITITIPENYLDHLDIHFGELELSISKQISLVLRTYIEQVIAQRNQPLSIGGWND